jgi:hypothetical protein
MDLNGMKRSGKIKQDTQKYILEKIGLDDSKSNFINDKLNKLINDFTNNELT